ncbi:hypothetical protein ACP70R_007566 [Stipagrostis hirtigluma subsp. patula]
MSGQMTLEKIKVKHKRLEELNKLQRTGEAQRRLTLVPIILDLTTPSYTKWHGLFLLTVVKYGLSDHILANAAYPNVPALAYNTRDNW